MRFQDDLESKGCMDPGQIDIEALLSKTEAFMRTIHFVRGDFNLVPARGHIFQCLNRSDLLEMRDEFVLEMTAGISSFVYSIEKQRKIQAHCAVDRDPGAAWQLVHQRSREKFREGSLNGQFSEMLLFVLLQHHFKAAPFLRKMPITTNPNLERNGADAIHIGRDGDELVLYLGEAKTYPSAKGKVRPALAEAIEDIVTTHYVKHRKELNLYRFEDFISPELEQLAQDYLDGKVDLRVELVCIATYEAAGPFPGMSKTEILQNALNIFQQQVTSKRFDEIFDKIPDILKPRMNYIVFPVNELTNLVDAFRERLGK